MLSLKYRASRLSLPCDRHHSVLYYCGSLSAIYLARPCRLKIAYTSTVAIVGAREGTVVKVDPEFLLMYFVRVAEGLVEHGRTIVLLAVETLPTYTQIVLRLERALGIRVLGIQISWQIC